MQKSLSLAALLLAGAVATACSSATPSSPSGTDDTPGAKDGGGKPTTPNGDKVDGGETSQDAATEPPPVPNLDPGDKGKDVPDAIATPLLGTYAMRMKVATVQDVPILGKSPSVSTAWGTAVIARSGKGLTLTETGCHVDVQGAASVSTTVPDAIAQSVVAVARDLRVWDEGGALKWARPEAIVPVGVKLSDPAKDALPKDANDPRVWDQDKDGKPGVTVKLSGIASGDIYVVQKQRSVFAGGITGTLLQGLVVDTSEQAVVGATNPLLNQPVVQTRDPDDAKSNVVLVRDKADLTCADMLARKDAIFAGK